MNGENKDRDSLQEVLTPSNGDYNGGGRDLAPLRGGERLPESFHYVEVGHTTAEKETGAPVPAPISFGGQEGLGRGVLIDIEHLDAFAAHYRSGVQRSHFRFATSDFAELRELAGSGRLSMLGDYYAVFTARTSSEIVHAINQAIDLVERLKENYNVPYEAVTVYFAGADLEVHVDHGVFDIAPSSELPDEFARMTAGLIGIEHGENLPAGFSQLDMGAYRYDYMSAIPGTQVPGERETFKIRITYATFKRFSYQRLNEFTQRRPDLPAREAHPGVSARARDFYQGVSTSLKREAAGGDHDTIATIFYRIEEDGSEIATAKQLGPTLLKRLFNENRSDIHTFSPHLDRALGGGMNPGDLYIVAGFPGSGTSTFALQLMNHVAEHHDAHCVFVGLQRGVEELFKRSLSSLGNIAVGEIDAKRQTPRALYEDADFNRRIMAAYEQYQQFADRIVILEGAAASDLTRLTQFLRERKEALKLQGDSSNVLLVVDSLQLMVAVMRAVYNRPDGQSTDFFGSIGEEDVRILAGRLKGIARELDVTVLATMEHYDSSRSLIEQCDSARIAQLFFDTQFADTVMLLSRQGPSLKALCDSLRAQLKNTPLEHKVDDLTRRLGEIEKHYQGTESFAQLNSEFALLDILKNRSGPVDKVAFAFHKNFSRFEPLEYQ
ncbi:MAG: DnaB helicase C-terminal domain-containing protein [bacterium]|nr:DnaB helicase C-terminal domain-containing protein [bacterium]